METPLTVTKNDPRNKQARKLYYRVVRGIRKSGVLRTGLQSALGYPGTGMEDGIAAVIAKYAKKAAGIITPVRAEDSGLVTNGYKVKIDDLEGDINLANLDYSVCPVEDADGEYVNGETMLERAKKARAYGSLGFTAALLELQDEGKEIFPVESRGKYSFIMPRTVLLNDDGDSEVAGFRWDPKSQRWAVVSHWLDVAFFYSAARFVCPREKKT